jgi:hypothetical protein
MTYAPGPQQEPAPAPAPAGPARSRHGALLAGLAGLALLALLTTWTAALARVPQQRAAVERLLRAQTGLDVRYGRLAVRLGFYGPEAEFGNVEMRRPGSDSPLLRAPRMVARFESWRLLRGGQLRPGRVIVSGAELDLRQLLELRRAGALDGAANRRRAASTARAAAGARGAAPDASLAEGAALQDAAALEDLEARLPRLLAGIPEGSLDFEAVTLLWSAGSGGVEPLQLRAPRLYASRRVDGAQLSGTLLLPARLGRTLFVAAQLRDAGAAHGGLQGRIRMSGRGLVLAQWRDLGALPAWVEAGVGDLTLAAQLRDGRVVRADGEARLAGLGLATAPPLVARRFGVAAAEFAYDRLPDARRYQLLQVEMAPSGDSAPLFGERGSLELRLGDVGGAARLVARRVPVELLAFLAAGGEAAAARESLPLRVSGGALEEFEARWPAARPSVRRAPGALRVASAPPGAPALPQAEAIMPSLQGKLVGGTVGSADGQWSLDGVEASFRGEGGHLQLQLQARDRTLRAPGFQDLPLPQRATLAGHAVLGASRDGWSAVLQDLELTLAEGPRLRLSGSLGMSASSAVVAPRAAPADAPTALDASTLRVALVEPLPRARMAALQQALEPWLPPDFWQRFEAGRLETASAEWLAGRLRTAQATLRAADFAAVDPLPRATALDLDLAWDQDRLEGRARAGRFGAFALESGRIAWSPQSSVRATSGSRGRAADRTRLELEAQLTGSLREALELARVGALPAGALAELDGRAALALRWREPVDDTADARARALELGIDVSQARWRLVPGAAALEGLAGRLRADGNGLRDGRVSGRWLGGPVDLRLEGAAPGGLRVTAGGRLERAALQREWAWVELVAAGGRDTIDWRAEARADPDASIDAATPWRIRVTLPGSARADLRWTPADATWRLDRGTVQFGDGPALAGIPGALVVGGRIERLDLAGLAGALAGAAAAGGWQRPLVGEVAIGALELGAMPLGAARLRLAGSRESSSVDLDGSAIEGELRQRHDAPGVLQARFARLQLPVDAPLATLPLAAAALRGSIELRIADLRLAVAQGGARSLGELVTTVSVDETAVATRDFALRRGAQRLGASGRCERATLGCSAEIALAGADLAALQRDLGHAARLRGGEATATGRLAWTMAQGRRFAAGLQGEIELSTALAGFAEAEASPGAAAPQPVPASVAVDAPGAIDDAAAADSTWPLLAPLLAVVAHQAQQSGAVAAPLPFERLDLRVAFEDGIGRIERYDAVGRDARLSIAGRFDFRRDTLEQQADWYWIAPGVSGAVERLDPRSPLAAGLRTLRELLARPPQGTAAARGAPGPTRPGSVERLQLEGPFAAPRVGSPALLDSPR